MEIGGRNIFVDLALRSHFYGNGFKYIMANKWTKWWGLALQK